MGTHGSRSSGLTVLISLLVLLVTPLLFAQVQSGSVVGKAMDQSGAALPGVTVTLSGIGAPQTFVTDAEGNYRFLNLDPGTYELSAMLEGFSSLRQRVLVTVGRSAEVNLKMAAAVAETLTVTAVAPVIDTRSASTGGAIVDHAELENIPTARDPWVVLQSVPSVLVDRVNVGGNESGQQSYFIGKGVERHQTEWNIDGVPVSDMAATGTSAFYYDFDAFEEMQISTGSSDPSVRTPGVHLNMVTKRGTNELRGSARYFTTNKDMQAEGSIPDDAKSYLASGVNSVDGINDYGLEVGGPILRDRLWIWGAHSNNGINNFAATNAIVTGTNPQLQRTKLENWNGKLNAQITRANEADIYFMWNEKKVNGRGLSTTRPPETALNQAGPGDILKFEDTHIINANHYLSASYATIRNGYTLTPVGGRDVDAWWDSDNGWHRTYNYFEQDAPQKNTHVEASSYVKLGALNHELKYGFDYRDTPVRSETVWPGNGNFGNFYDDYALAALTRPAVPNFGSRYKDAYLGDTVVLRNLTLTGGVRYDLQSAKNFGSNVPANPVVPDLLPAVSYAGDERALEWKGFSPRITAAYALDTAKKTVIRGGYNRYMDQLGSSDAGSSNPFYRVQMLYYYWEDLNGDKTVQRNEIDFDSGLYSFKNIDPDNPAAGYAPGRIDYNQKPTRTDEFNVGVEREIGAAFGVSLNYTWRKRTNFTWDQYEKTRGAGDFYTSADYVLAGSTTGTLPDGSTYSVPYYKLKPGTPVPTNYVTTNRPDYYQTYNGLELAATKRLTDKWMLRGNVTVMDWKQHVGPDGFVNPTPIVSGDSCTSCNGDVVASSGGIAGYINSRWAYSVNSSYNLPLGFTAAAAAVGREGYVIPYFRRVNPGDSSGNKEVLVSDSFGNDRLPDLFNLDLRLAKDFNLAGRAGLNLSIDLFNATNQRTVLWRDNRMYTANGTDLTRNNKIEQLQSPRIWRLGARIKF
ncbi:MAG TPA: TonB-dependent receptor [Thermoanaerobaculia bacterium]|nr:TonB-dependent receptor [Thermoanaerobaculia bacterium]